MLAHHCDHCGTWQRAQTSFPPFLIVTEGDEVIGHYCCYDCLMLWAATVSTPKEEI